MGFLYALEAIRTTPLGKLMGAVTYLGDEICFMVFAVGVFWCVSKRMGYYLMTVGFFGMILNQFLKILCCVPRPWVKDPDFTIVEPARAGATDTRRTRWRCTAASPGVRAAWCCGWCASCWRC